MKTPDYLSYDRYKKKKVANPNRRMLIFITTFFVMLLLFTAIAKALSPDVDVTIGDDPQAEPKETGLGVKRFIDERLKMIQREDTGSASVQLGDTSSKNTNTLSSKKNSEYNDSSFDNYSEALDEKMDAPIKKSSATNSVNQKAAAPLPPPRPTNRDLSTPYASARTAKVYVGRYSTMEQARVAQEILSDSGLGISPTVKDLGGVYTLQVGAYSSRSRAEGVASELQRNNFPARVVE